MKKPDWNSPLGAAIIAAIIASSATILAAIITGIFLLVAQLIGRPQLVIAPMPTPTPLPASVPAATPTFTPSPTSTYTPVPSLIPTSTPIPETPTPTVAATLTPIPMPTPQPTATPTPIPTSTPEPPTTTSSVTLTPPDPYIPLFNARATALRFFESGQELPPRDERVFAQRFDRDTTRHINWQLDLENSAPGRRIDFSIVAIYHRYNGSSWEEIWRGTTDTYVEGDWEDSYYTWGLRRNWEIGMYRVDLYVEDKKIVSVQFEIYAQFDPYIPSLNARVTELRFFESGKEGVARDEKVFAERFDSETARYINWQLDLEYPEPRRRIDFRIGVIYYRDDGAFWKEFERQTAHTYVEGDWVNSFHSWGIGRDDPGYWEVGYYSVDLHVEGKKIASGQFEIY